jgi:hypothetical protein
MQAIFWCSLVDLFLIGFVELKTIQDGGFIRSISWNHAPYITMLCCFKINDFLWVPLNHCLLRWIVKTKNTVCWFIIRKKYYSSAEKLRLIRQANKLCQHACHHYMPGKGGGAKKKKTVNTAKQWRSESSIDLVPLHTDRHTGDVCILFLHEFNLLNRLYYVWYIFTPLFHTYTLPSTKSVILLPKKLNIFKFNQIYIRKISIFIVRN